MNRFEFIRKIAGNFIIQLAIAWVVAYWLAVYAFTGPTVKSSTDIIVFGVTFVLAVKWASNAIDGVRDQGVEGRGRLAIGLFLIVAQVVISQLRLFHLDSIGQDSIALNDPMSGFIKSIGLAGFIFCLFAEPTAAEFTANRRWYRTAIVGIICLLLGFSIRPFFGF